MFILHTWRNCIAACLVYILSLAIPVLTQAALIDRGGGLIYDDILDITWLQDANYSQSSGDDADGLMNWPDALNWVGNLSYVDSVRGIR